MERVQVLDNAGKVVYVIDSRGGTVFIGRDKKKCGIALAVDAQGVSRVHGSLTWTNQDELTYSDTSTYGTLVDGKLVKGDSHAVRDGSHISVGDVELNVLFSHPSSCLPASSQSLMTSKKNSSTKRKVLTSGSVSNEIKRSKLDARANSSQPRQSQISSFFQKKSHIADDDDCMILAEDTPQIQKIGSKDDVVKDFVSFVTDSNAVPINTTLSSSNEKHGQFSISNNQSGAKSQLSSSTTIRRRKKQSIFDFDLRPVPHRPQPVTLAEDTVLDAPQRIRRNYRKDTTTSANVTCVPETCEQNSQARLTRGRKTTSNSATVPCDASEASNFLAPDVSILSNTVEKSTIARGASREPSTLLPVKKAKILDTVPSKTRSRAEKDEIEEISAIEDEKQTDVNNLLKLVSTGKRYDDFRAEDNDDEDKGLEIERVVAKLNELVHYADIERPPKRVDTCTPQPSAGDHKYSNFKRFKKARQGRFNASLSSANLSCRVAGNADLVDFRQLS